MKPSAQIATLQNELDNRLPRVWLWIVGDLQEVGIQVATLEETNATLLDILRSFAAIHEGRAFVRADDGLFFQAQEAIRKAQ